MGGSDADVQATVRRGGDLVVLALHGELDLAMALRIEADVLLALHALYALRRSAIFPAPRARVAPRPPRVIPRILPRVKTLPEARPDVVRTEDRPEGRSGGWPEDRSEGWAEVGSEDRSDVRSDDRSESRTDDRTEVPAEMISRAIGAPLALPGFLPEVRFDGLPGVFAGCRETGGRNARPGEKAMVVDLRHVTFMDCSGLDLLCRLRDEVTARGGRLALMNPRPIVLRLLKLAALREPFELIEQVDDDVLPGL
ncbi:STAS domain-containing protein [Streptomyces sp. NPDC053542]|uniref:STAS domain-containing protein n=1 Tax=Streptomyces sp. NPDC053542 TaxID=3365710 RepID=UPI0037CF8F2C